MLKVFSPAKINLGLKIIKKRGDGYHEISTIFQKISLRDTLIFKERKTGIKLFSDHQDLPGDENNLVYQAAKILKEDYKIKTGATIHLKKNIPLSAGLGGGSSNAASTLVSLNRLWKIGLKKKELHELALKLGADVPFFLSFSSTALAQGIGERLYPFRPGCPLYLVLINPGIYISTPWAYKIYPGTGTGDKENDRPATLKNLPLTNSDRQIKMIKKFYRSGNIIALGKNLFNDLEAGVIKKYPLIQEIKEKLTALGARGSLMSGSGSTVFGIFPDKERALSASVLLRKAGKRKSLSPEKIYLCQTEI